MKRRDAGATIIETAIVLPLFLAIIFIIIWVAIVLNAKATLSTSLGRSLRLASTRGNPMTLGRDLFDLSNVADLKDLLCFRLDEDPDLDACLSIYDQCYVQQLFNDQVSFIAGKGLANAKGLPDNRYRYLTFYINESMRQSLGNMVRYPCTPSNGEEWCPGYAPLKKTQNTSGCMICRLINAMQTVPGPSVPRIDLNKAMDFKDPESIASLYGSIGVECAYEVDSTLLRPVQIILNMTGIGGIVISSSQVLVSDNHGDPNSIY